MKYHRYLAAGLCGMFVLSGFAYAAPAPQIKLRKSGERGTEILVDLTAEGTRLEAEYAAMLEAVRAELKKEIPAVEDAKKAALLTLLKAEMGPAKELAALDKALRITRGSEDNYTSLVEKLRNTPGWLTEAEKKLKEAKALPDNDPTREKRVTDGQKKVERLKADLARLPGDIEKARATWQNAGAEEARLMKEAEAANRATANARTATQNALDDLGLGKLLGSDRLDAKFARFIVLSEGKPRFLAQFAQQGPEKKKLIDQLLSDTPLMLQMIVADGPYWGKYPEAMEIYRAIQKASPRASEGVLQRMAVATSLVHAVPIPERVAGDVKRSTKKLDPVKRYLSYQKAYLDGELDPAFKNFSTWELTHVMDGKDPDEAFVWARQVMRTYRPDLIERGYNDLRYSQVVDAEIQYTSSFVAEDRPELTFMQNILCNGGICGRRAFFGRFVLRAFGIPTVERREPGHATLVQWAPDGWISYLGGDWGGRSTIERYGYDLNFLANTQARGNEAGFMKVKRAQWIGDLMGEPMVFGLQDPKQEPQFWYAVSLAEQSRAGDGRKRNTRNPIPALSRTQEAPAAERAVTVDRVGVITIPAVATKIPAVNAADAAWGAHNAVSFTKSNLGGMQLHYSRYGGTQVLEYTFDAPRAGKYALTSRIASTRWDMSLLVSVNGAPVVEMPIPFKTGLWETSKPIVIELKAGANTLTFARPEDMRKGIAIKDFTLKPVK